MDRTSRRGGDGNTYLFQQIIQSILCVESLSLKYKNYERSCAPK